MGTGSGQRIEYVFIDVCCTVSPDHIRVSQPNGMNLLLEFFQLLHIKRFIPADIDQDFDSSIELQ